MADFIQCIDMDGANEYINIPDNATMKVTDNLSVVAWCECSSESFDEVIVARYASGGNNRSWEIYSDPTANKLRVIVSDDGTYAGHCKDYESTNEVLTNGWHQVAFTFATGTMKVYVDGAELTGAALTKTQDTAITAIASKAVATRIGQNSDGAAGGYWDGKICNVSMWSTTVLSDADIAALYNSGAAMDPADLSTSATLVSSWLWNIAITDPTVPDNTGSNTGTYVNGEQADIVDSPFQNIPADGRLALDNYTLIQPSPFIPMVDIVEGGGTVKDAILMLAKNQNYIHRNTQKAYVIQDTQSVADTEFAAIVTTALVGAPDLIHIWRLDHLLSDADLKLTFSYMTTDGGAGSEVGVKAWLIEPDGTTQAFFTSTVDNAGTFTTESQTYAEPWDDVADPTDAHLLVFSVYEVDVGATITLKQATAESVAATSVELASGIRSSGFVPNDTRAFDANSPLDIIHARQLVDNIEALNADKNSTFCCWSEYLSETGTDFYSSPALSASWVRLIGPIPVSVQPGLSLWCSILGYGEHAACKYRIYTKAMEKTYGVDGIDKVAFLNNSATIDPEDHADWATRALEIRPPEKGLLTFDNVYIELVTPTDGGAGRDTAVIGLCIWEE